MTRWRGTERPIVLCGMPGAGKSTIGPRLAAALGWRFVDLDDAIERASGRTISAWFAVGEPEFRAYEATQLVAQLQPRTVLALGGGAVKSDENFARVQAAGTVVWLNAPTAILASRVDADAHAGKVRPLLQATDSTTRALDELLALRRARYASADLHVDANAAPDAIAEHLVAHGKTTRLDVALDGGAHTYPIVFDAHAGSEARFADELSRHAPASRYVVITDDHVARLHADRYAAALPGSTHTIVVPHGEASKSLAQMESILDELAAQRADRRAVIIALGGGVIGDLAGFVAATYLRGIRYVQVPTTVLAQVDSSVGGKTGVNLRAGKNLVGAFHQPQLVWIDATTLTTLSSRDRAAGLAEVVKHALLAGEADLHVLEVNVAELSDGEPGALLPHLERSCSIKARVVAADEREESTAPDGGRAQLNFGHTLGHAFEAESFGGDAPLRHGEAIALGMLAELALGTALGITPPSLTPRVTQLVSALCLPTDHLRHLTAQTTSFLLRDKKNRHHEGESQIRFVLLAALGQPITVEVPLSQIELLLRSNYERPQS